MGDNNICIIWNETFRMVVCDAKELHTFNGYSPILQKEHIVRQVLNVLGIPQTKVMIPCHKQLIGIGQVDEPIEEIQDLLFCPVVSEVATMHNHIGSW